MPPLEEWPDEKRDAAKAMLASGESWANIARAFGCSYSKVKSELVPGYREFLTYAQLKTRAKKSELRNVKAEAPVVPETRNPLYDPRRDGFKPHSSLTAELLGDPFPGRDEVMRRAG